MKIASLDAALMGLLGITGVVATPSPAATTASAAPTCTASLITALCDYSDPFRAVASEGLSSCWEYCNNNQPCEFVIFSAGNPYTGAGSCWVYPGESFDESKGSTDGCDNPYLSVYDKPVCDAPTTTVPGGYTCSATASPSAVASICGYPTPDDDCWNSCAASTGAPHCLSLCAESDSCEYAVFNPRGETNSPYEPGTCWIYADGEYNPDDAGSCSSQGPEQYVYINECPKPPSASSTTTMSSATSTETGGSSAAETAGGDDAEDEEESITGNAAGAENGDADGTDEGAASAPAAHFLAVIVTAGLAMLL